MAELSRIGVAIASDLLGQFDRLVEQRGYGSRSEAFRDLIRDALVPGADGGRNAAIVVASGHEHGHEESKR